MAYTVAQTFANGHIRLARSPLIVTIWSDDIGVTDPSYRYMIRLRAWDGDVVADRPASPTITLYAIPDPDKRGLFNCAPILQDVLTPSEPLSTGYHSTAGTWWVELEYGYVLNGIETVDSTSTTTPFTDGFALAPQAINEYNFFDGINDASEFMVSIKEGHITAESKAWIHYYARNNPSTAVKYRDDSGEEFLHQGPFSPPVPPINDSTETVRRFPMGLADVLAISTNPSFNPQRYFDVILYEYIDPVNDIDTYRVNIKPRAFCDIEEDTICFINRYGVWDYLPMRGRPSDKISQKRTEWDRRVTTFNGSNELVYPEGISQKGAVGVMASGSMTLRTGQVDEYVNQKIIDLLASKTHFSMRLGQSVFLKTSSVALITASDVDPIEYTLEFEIAGNLIQNIQ